MQGLTRAGRNASRRELQNEKLLPSLQFEPGTFRVRNERATTELRGLMSVEWLKVLWVLPECPITFLYAPCGHVVTGDLSIVQNDKLRDLLRKGPKFREPVSFSWHQNFDIIMDACEAYARQWAKKEDVELDTLSEWIKSVGEVVKRRIRRLKHSVNTRSESIFRDPDVIRELSRLHENFVIVPADKASNNYTFVCKRHYVDILIEELGLHSLP